MPLEPDRSQPDPTLPDCTRGLWHDPDWTFTNPGTFAVVIGVSRYDYLEGGARNSGPTYTLGQLYVSALTADRVFCWLREEYRYSLSPLVYCWLLLAPTPDEEPLLSSAGNWYADPTLPGCKQAIRAWFRTMDGMSQVAAGASRSFFFFSGHGLELSNEQQILLPSDCQDVRQGGLNDSISTDNLYRGMHRLGVPQQFFFIDACRNDHYALHGTLLTGQKILDEPGIFQSPVRRVAPIFFASAWGAQAFQPTNVRLGPSFFGQALLDGVRGREGIQVDCDDTCCAVRISALLGFLERRTNRLLQRLDPSKVQEVRMGGSAGDVTLAEVPRDSVTAAGPASFATPAAYSHETALGAWTPGAGAPVQSQLRQIFGSEQMEGIWRRARLFDLQRRAWLSEGDYVLHAVSRAQTARYQIVLSAPATQGGHLLQLQDAATTYLCYLPDIDGEGPRYDVSIDATPPDDQPSDPGLRITRLAVQLSDDNPGALGAAAQLWRRARQSEPFAAAQSSALAAALAPGASALAQIVAAVVLLQAGRIDQLEPWLGALAARRPIIADAAVLHLERLIRSAGALAPGELEYGLAQAEQGGMPATADALGFAVRQVGDRIAASVWARPAGHPLLIAKRYLRGGGLFVVLAGPRQDALLTPDLFFAELPAQPLALGELAQHMRGIMLRVPELYTYHGVLTIFALGEGLRPHTAFVPSAATPSASQQVDSILAYLLCQSNARDLLRELLALLPARTADQALQAQMRELLALFGPTP